MGHTNYWNQQRELPAKAFAAAVKDCKTIMRHLKIPLGGPDGTGRPVFGPDIISFNGKGEYAYETFSVSRLDAGPDEGPTVFNFCKTNHLPYDLCVQAALIVLKRHLGKGIIVSSDGEDSDWEGARQACQRWLGYGEEFRLER